MREAWVSPHDNSVRLTFDRHICAEPCFHARAAVEMERPARVFPELVVLELKFTTRFPNWFNALVRRFDLMQFSSAKYCEGVEVLGWHRFVNNDRSMDWEAAAELSPAPAGLALQLAAAAGGEAL
jgi:hypothetical protein